MGGGSELSTGSVDDTEQIHATNQVETVEQLDGRASVHAPVVAEAETHRAGEVGMSFERERAPDPFEGRRRRCRSGARFLSRCLDGFVRWSGLGRGGPGHGDRDKDDEGAAAPTRGAALSRLIGCGRSRDTR